MSTEGRVLTGSTAVALTFGASAAVNGGRSVITATAQQKNPEKNEEHDKGYDDTDQNGCHS